MDLKQLAKDLEEIKGCIEDNHIEKAEDLLVFVIGEINIAAQQGVQADGNKIALDGTFRCPECNFSEKHLASCSRR